MMCRRCAFTLVEIMAVIVLIGLLAGMVAVSMTRDAQRAQRQDVINRLIDADASARIAAKRLGPSKLRIDLNQQKLWLMTPDPTTKELRPGHVMRVAPNYKLTGVSWIDPQPARNQTRTPRQTLTYNEGTIELPYSGEGLTRTFVLRLDGPASDPVTGRDDPTQIQTSWLMFSGLTGQNLITDELETIDNLLAMLASTRPDAD